MIATSRFTLRRLINDSNARVAFDRLRDASIVEFIVGGGEAEGEKVVRNMEQ